MLAPDRDEIGVGHGRRRVHVPKVVLHTGRNEDVEQTTAAAADMETVRCSGWTEDDRARPDLMAGAADLEGNLAVEDDERLTLPGVDVCTCAFAGIVARFKDGERAVGRVGGDRREAESAVRSA